MDRIRKMNVLCGLMTAAAAFFSCELCFASEEIRLPDINIIGDDLSLYGLADLDLRRMPDNDKEKFLSDFYHKRKYRRAPLAKAANSVSLALGNDFFSYGNASFLRSSSSRRTGLVINEETDYIELGQRRGRIIALDGVYISQQQTIMNAAAGIRHDVYEAPGTPAKRVSSLYAETPVSLAWSGSGSFGRVTMIPEAARIMYPSLFLPTSGSASFFSMSLAGDFNGFRDGYSFKADGKLSTQSWDWISDENSFVSGNINCRIEKEIAGIQTESSVKMVKWDNTNRILAGLIMEKEFSSVGIVSIGIDPQYYMTGIHELASRRAVILNSFTDVAYDNYKNGFIGFSTAFGPGTGQVKFTRRQTRNFLYVDESSAVFGFYSPADLMISTLFAEVVLGPPEKFIGLRNIHNYISMGPVIARNEFSLFSGFSAAGVTTDMILVMKSKTLWVDGFVRPSVKICYNLPHQRKIFLIFDNLLGDTVYRSRYDFMDSRVFMAGMEIKF